MPTHLSLNVPADLKTRLKAEAERQGVPINQLANQILSHMLEQTFRLETTLIMEDSAPYAATEKKRPANLPNGPPTGAQIKKLSDDVDAANGHN